MIKMTDMIDKKNLLDYLEDCKNRAGKYGNNTVTEQLNVIITALSTTFFDAKELETNKYLRTPCHIQDIPLKINNHETRISDIERTFCNCPVNKFGDFENLIKECEERTKTYPERNRWQLKLEDLEKRLENLEKQIEDLKKNPPQIMMLHPKKGTMVVTFRDVICGAPETHIYNCENLISISFSDRL